MVGLNLFLPKPCYDTLLEGNYINYEDHWYLGLKVLSFLWSAKGIQGTSIIPEKHEELFHTDPAPGAVWLTEVQGAAAHSGITIPGFSITCTCLRGPVLSCNHFLFDTQDTPCPSCNLPAKCRSSLVVLLSFPSLLSQRIYHLWSIITSTFFCLCLCHNSSVWFCF